MIRALRNFEYTEMNVDVDYAPDGALAALVRLRGRNPDVENGRAIHFNMNVSENILALLDSIRASEATQQRVQQRLSR
ncbi:MAG: intermembrane phospholipid transport protein YdbH family protein [Candidatus Azotimanducaceae bacterium WSBS_2022_MAG_OTU7]